MGKIKEITTILNSFLATDSLFTKLAFAIILLAFGWFLTAFFSKLLNKFLLKRNFDKTLRPFFINVFLWGQRVLLFIVIAAYLGVETTSFITVLGAISFALGMAMQGALANFAGGVLILMNRPYKIGDLVEMQGSIGVVKEIQVFNTILLSAENKTVILPNGAVSNGNITNYTVEGLIRVDLKIGISYDADIKKAKKVLLELLQNNENVLQTPAPFVGVLHLNDSDVTLAVRPYTKPAKYWDVYFTIYEDAKYALDEAGIAIPFPQLDVTISK